MMSRLFHKLVFLPKKKNETSKGCLTSCSPNKPLVHSVAMNASTCSPRSQALTVAVAFDDDDDEFLVSPGGGTVDTCRSPASSAQTLSPPSSTCLSRRVRVLELDDTTVKNEDNNLPWVPTLEEEEREEVEVETANCDSYLSAENPVWLETVYLYSSISNSYNDVDLEIDLEVVALDEVGADADDDIGLFLKSTTTIY
jgi:hypothetical protein